MQGHDTRVASLIEEARRELAVLSSDTLGTQKFLGQFARTGLSWAERRHLRDLIESTSLPCMVIDPRPGLRIVDVNDALAAAAMSQRYRIAGDKLFDAFPDNPDLVGSDGVSNLYASLRTATQKGRVDTMAVQRYDVRDPSGRFVERHWRPTNTPVFDHSGRLIYLLHHVEPVSGNPPSAVI